MLQHFAEVREQVRLNKAYEGLRVKNARPRFVFNNFTRHEINKMQGKRKVKSIFIPGLKQVYRPIFGASPATYYVKNGGDDGLDGLSDANAWETLDKINASSFISNDIIQTRRGDIFVDRLNVPDSGTPGNPIVFQTYGSGARPIFYGLITITGFVIHAGNIYKKTNATAHAQLYRQVFEDGSRLIYRGALGTMVQGSYFHDDPADTLYIWSTDDADPDTHTIERCQDWIGIDMNGKEYLTFDGIQVKGYATHGVNFTAVAGANNITLTDMLADWNCAAGFAQSGAPASLGSHIVYDSCIGNDNLGENFWIGNGNDHAMRNCISFNSGKDKVLKDYDASPLSHMCGGLVVGIRSTDVIVENNNFYDNYSPHPAIRNEFEVGYARPIGTIIRYNMLDHRIDPLAGGALVDEGEDAEVYYNIILAEVVDAALRIQDDSLGGEYSNNTIYLINGQAVVWLGPSTNSTLRNNIIYSEQNDAVIRVPVNGQGGFDSDYNCFYHEGAPNLGFIWGAVGYNTLALWIVQSGSDGNSFQNDPLFVDVPSDNYRLQLGSPCIDAGEDLGLPFDYYGASVPRGMAPDIGAIETLGSQRGRADYGDIRWPFRKRLDAGKRV